MLRPESANTDSVDAYYLLIHPCFPVLPPPAASSPGEEQAQLLDDGTAFAQDSPLLQAINTLVALVPKSSENSDAARAARHDYAGHCSDLTLKAIDRDMDSVEPLARSRFHQDVPVHLESTLAALLVAVYEYSYRGSMMRARTRMASVITMAMDLRLHDVGLESTSDLVCKQRLWAMIVSCMQYFVTTV